jgi:hypothetical protein
MMRLLDEYVPSRREVRRYQSQLEQCHEDVMIYLNLMMDICDEVSNEALFEKLSNEMEQLV